MVRILHVVTDMRRGGLETMLMNYYRHIDRTQVQFDFLTHREYDGDYDKEIQTLGGFIYHLPKLSPFSINYKKTLSSFFDEHPEYQVIHVHQDCLSSVILKVAKKKGISVRIAHSHSSNQDKNIKYPIKLFFRHFISRYATDLMACGRRAGNWMFCGAPYQILNNAINAEVYKFDLDKRIKIRQELGIKADEIIIGHVGRFSPPKNHLFLVRVFNAIENKKTKLLLVGDGALKSETEKYVREQKLTERVIFTGVRTDVAELLQAMDVFVLPSLYEGLGIVAIEAQAAGLPCVLSDQIPDDAIITDLTVKLSLCSSVEEWGEKIMKQSEVLRVDTYQYVKKAGFDIKDNAKKLQDFYLNCATGEKNLCLH